MRRLLGLEVFSSGQAFMDLKEGLASFVPGELTLPFWEGVVFLANFFFKECKKMAFPGNGK